MLLERIFVMTNVFSWQKSVSLCPVSFCIPRLKLLVTPGISWLPTFAFQSPMVKRTSFFFFFLVLVLKGHVCLHRTGQLQLLWHWRLGHRLGLLWCWLVCLGNKPWSSIVFEIAPKYCISDSFADYKEYSISSKGFLPIVVNIMVIWIKFALSHLF